MNNNGPLVYVPKTGPNAERFRTPKQRAARRKKNKKLQTFLDIVVVLLVAGATYAMFKLTNVAPENQEINNPSVVADKPKEEEDAEEPAEAKIDLSPVLSSWMGTLSGGVDAGIKIVDLDNEIEIGEINANKQFATASEYKLFVVYEGWRRVETKEWDAGETVYGGYNIEECLDRAIRESHSGCAEALWGKIGRDDLEYIIKNVYGLENSSAKDLSSTPSDMVEMMRYYYVHKDLSAETWKKIQDSMLNQPASDPADLCGGSCNWRQGLPAGFTRGTNVYNKVGWDHNGAHWTIYNDVAILEFPKQNRHFAMAVMTQNFSTTERIVALGDAVEEAILAYLELEN
ncbi:serine hydrolase [Candidatus Saccharibacteria bacterium]|nr:serine hydrolase [Candidatus Saccharibacteria bacterium]